MPVQQFRQVLLVDWNATLAQRAHFGLVVVHTDHAVTDFSKTCRGHKAHIARTNNYYRDGFDH